MRRRLLVQMRILGLFSVDMKEKETHVLINLGPQNLLVLSLGFAAVMAMIENWRRLGEVVLSLLPVLLMALLMHTPATVAFTLLCVRRFRRRPDSLASARD